MGKNIFFIAALLLSLSANAQRKGTILNMEDGIPIREVTIYTNNKQTVFTNYKGEFYIPKAFTSVTIVKAGFVSRTLNLYEMPDTIELLPKFNTLDEVIILGKKNRFSKNAKVKIEPWLYNLPKTGFSFDFSTLFNNRKKLNKQLKEKHDEIINSY